MQQFAGYTEKEVLHDALVMQKDITGTYNTASNECACPNLRKVMLDILNDEHGIQFDVFNDMHTRGYYPTTPAQQDKISKVKDTYAKSAGGTGQSNNPLNVGGQQTNTGAWHTKG